MFLENDQLRKLTTLESFTFFTISILINTMANALTVSTNLGSAIWTASAVNLSKFSEINLGIVLGCYGILVIGLNSILVKHVDVQRIIGNLLFIFPFSYLVQYFTHIFAVIGIPQQSFGIRAGLDLVGVFGIGIAVSIYQRVNLILHPNDDLSYILRFKFFEGRAAKAQYVSYGMPILITIICIVFTKHIFAINFGTVISLIVQGPVTGWADNNIFSRLKHRIYFK